MILWIFIPLHDFETVHCLSESSDFSICSLRTANFGLTSTIQRSNCIREWICLCLWTQPNSITFRPHPRDQATLVVNRRIWKFFKRELLCPSLSLLDRAVIYISLVKFILWFLADVAFFMINSSFSRLVQHLKTYGTVLRLHLIVENIKQNRTGDRIL